MDDMISRQAAIDAAVKMFEAWYGCSFLREREIRVRFDALPSAQQWIPCSERLPEAYVDVLVWFEYYRYGDYNCLYQMHGIGTYIKEYDSWIINHETGWGKLRVFAWMPLPEPWKGEEHDTPRTMLPKKSLR